MKPLSSVAIAELDLDALYAGKLWAFVPVNSRGAWGLGIAVANERGYSPIPLFYCHVPEGPGAYELMADHADALNEARGIAARIVASTMRRSEPASA